MPSPMTKKIIFDTIRNIIKDDNVKGYEIGLTKDIEQRRRNYINQAKWCDLQPLENSLTSNEAIKRAEIYFIYLTQDDENPIFYDKYNPDDPQKRDRERFITTIPRNDGREIYHIHFAWYK